MRDSNIWRKKQGIPAVRIGGDTAGLGTRYFEDAEKDAQEESQEVVDAFFNDAEKGFGNEKLMRKIYESRKKNVTIAYQEGVDGGGVHGENSRGADKARLMRINNW